MKADWYFLIERALEEGIEKGWNRAHKHTDTPDMEIIKSEIVAAQINNLCDFIIWNKEELA